MLDPASYILAKKGLKKPDSREAIKDFFASPFWDNIPDKPPLIKSNSVRNLFISTSEPSPESVGDLWIRGEVWPYRQAITISNSNSEDLTDFQVKLELNANNVGEHFDWSRKGADLRFYTADGQKIPYWVESWDEANKQAVIWIKVPSIPTGGSTTIYMYYGNPSAASESDPNQVFDLYDDFDTFDTSKWTAKGVNVSASNSELKVTMSQNANQEVYASSPLNDKLCLEARMRYAAAGDYMDFGLGMFQEEPDLNNAPLSIRANISQYNSSYGLFYRNANNSETEIASASLSFSNLSTYRVFRLTKNGDNCEFEIEGIGSISGTLGVQINVNYAGLFLDLDSGDDLRVDWIRVRKYAEQEPSAQFGAEEVTNLIDAISPKLWNGSEWVGNIEARSIYPEVDNTYNCGSPASRWKNVYAVNVQTGDVVFQNGWRITEFDENGKLMDGLRVLNKGGAEILRITEDGLYFKGKKIGGGE